MATDKTYARRDDALKAGWFSTRHQTGTAHIAAQEKRRMRMEQRREREQNTVKRSADEQIARLDAMFGKNKGAKKERAKLAAKKN